MLMAVIAGVLLAAVVPLSPTFCFLSAIAFLLIGFALRRRSERVSALFIVFAFASLGLGRARQIMIPAPRDVSRYAGRPSLWIQGTIVSDIDRRERGASAFTIAVSGVNDYRGVYPAEGRIRVYLKNASETPEIGDVLLLRGRIETPPGATNPGAFDYGRYLATQGVFSMMHVRGADDLRRVQRGETPLYWLVKRMRLSVRRSSALLVPRYAGLMNGLVLSDRDRLTVDITEAFARTGTVHLLSVSGTHLSALIAFLLLIFGILYAPRPMTALISIGYLWLFSLASGGSAATLRAALMASIVLAAPFVRRAPQMWNSLVVAALILLLCAPGDLYDMGFQFSFIGMASLCLYGLPLARMLLRREPDDAPLSVTLRPITTAVLMGAIFTLGTAPLTAYYFNFVSVVGVLANCIVIPLGEALTLIGLIGSYVILIPCPFAGPILLPLMLLARLIMGLFLFFVHAFAALPGAAFAVSSPPLLFVLGYYAILGILAPFFRRYALRKTLFDPTPALAPALAAGGADPASPAGMPHGKP